jgi:hypothetical protein
MCSCGGSSTSDTQANNTPTEIVNANPANNAAVVPYAPANGSFNANTSTNTNTVTVTKPTGNTKPMTYSAPDDSDYSTTMNAKGQAVETRVFHSNKFISKIVRTWSGVNDKTVSIYLKNGKIVNVAGDKWPDIKGQPVENFYPAAGIDPGAAVQYKPANGKTVEKSNPVEKQ